MVETDWKPSGLLGGWVYAGKERREKQTHEHAMKRSDLDLQQKAMEVQDYSYETKQRRIESDVKLQKAEREKKLSNKLDKEAELKIDGTILGLETAMDITKLEAVAQSFADVKDQQTYEMALDSMTGAQRKKWGLDKIDNYKDAFPVMKYITAKAAHSMDQLRKLEITGLKGMYDVQAAAATAGWTPEGQSVPFSPDQQAAVSQSIVRDHDFYDLYDLAGGVGGDPTTSNDVVLASNMAAEEARQLLTENEAARRADKSHRVRSLGWAAAIDVAKENTKAFLFKGTKTSITGTPMLEMHSPQDAEAEFQAWKSMMWERASMDSNFMSLPPTRQERYLKLLYIEQKKAEMMTAKAKMYETVSNRTE
jgi:hypothetical protein